MDGAFAAYFAEVPYVPSPRVMNHVPPEANETYLERSAFAWIPYSTIEGYLKKEIDRTKKYPVDAAFLPAGAKTPWSGRYGWATCARLTRLTRCRGNRNRRLHSR